MIGLVPLVSQYFITLQLAGVHIFWLTNDLTEWTCFYRLCDDIDTKNTKDVSNLFSNLAGNFEGVVQYNRDNRKFEVRLLH